MKTCPHIMLVAGVVLVAVLTGLPGSAGAQPIYVSDVREISLRSGPSTDHRILRMLSAGDKLEELSGQGGWLRVRGPDGNEGWVLQRFTSRNAPVSVRYQMLRQDYDALVAASGGALDKVAELEEINENLLEALSETSNKLLDLDREYSALQEDVAGVLDLRQQFEQIAAERDALQAETEALRAENAVLKSRDRLMWFLAGAGIFLVAWLIGVITGRLQRKRGNMLRSA